MTLSSHPLYWSPRSQRNLLFLNENIARLKIVLFSVHTGKGDAFSWAQYQQDKSYLVAREIGLGPWSNDWRWVWRQPSGQYYISWSWTWITDNCCPQRPSIRVCHSCSNLYRLMQQHKCVTLRLGSGIWRRCDIQNLWRKGHIVTRSAIEPDLGVEKASPCTLMPRWWWPC